MPKELSSRETVAERIARGQNKAKIVAALIGSISTLLVGFAAAFLALPPFQEWVRSWGNDRTIQALEIEQIHQHVFPYYGEAENAGGFAKLELLFDGTHEGPSYELAYNIPGDKKGYAGLAFQFDPGFNLSNYKALECTVLFSQLNDVVDLYFKDIADNFNTIRVANNGANEMMVRSEFTNFPKINFNAVKEFGIVVSSDFSTGAHRVQIKNVRFVR